MSANEPDLPSIEGQQLPQYVLPAFIQLRNVFVAEINAKRYPIDVSTNLTASTSLSLQDIVVSEENSIAQAALNISISFEEDPKPFEIVFKVVGSFTYDTALPREALLQFLGSTSTGVLIPFARETLMSLCTRLQVPIIILPMIQLLPLPDEENAE